MTRYVSYSQRLKLRESVGVPEILGYESLPKKLRYQIIHILGDVLGRYVSSPTPSTRCNNVGWHKVHKDVAYEIGVMNLGRGTTPYQRCIDFIENTRHLALLDFLEIVFIYLRDVHAEWDSRMLAARGISMRFKDAVDQLNTRFLQNGVGYQFNGQEIIRVDSLFTHTEITLPALTLIHHGGYQGAEDEFRSAHSHHRHGDSKEAMTDALKAVESVIKVIAANRRWQFKEKNPNASVLIDAVFKNELLPLELTSQFNGIRSILESVSTLRNRQAGHGQGEKVLEVPSYMAAYALHSAAAAIVLLVEADKSAG